MLFRSLRPAAAKTIHKSQGDTMDKVVVNMGNSQMKHGHYVALSRVTKKSGLFITNLNEDKIKQDTSVVNEMKRLRSEAQLQLCFTPVYSMEQSGFTVVFHNVRSLHRHFTDVLKDPNYTSAHIIAVAESRLTSRDEDESYAIPDFQIVRNDQTDFSSCQQRPPHGIVLYIQNSLKIGHITNISRKEIEYTVVKLEYDGRSMHFCAFFKSQSCTKTTFEEHCQNLRQILDPHIDFILCGDFNCDISDNQNSRFVDEMKNLIGCNQFIKEATTDYNTVLDLIFSNIESVFTSVIDSPCSDHKLIAASVTSWLKQ